MKIDRLIGIVMFLLTREKITAHELSKYYEVSERTIYRDFNTLGQAGIPVISLQGSGGGFGIADGFTLSRQYLNKNDILSIIASLQGLHKLSGDNVYSSAKNKIESILTDSEREKLQNTQNVIDIDFIPWGQGEEFLNKMNIVYNAAREHKVCRILYRSTRHEVLHRDIEPVTIRFKEYAWYVDAYCRLRKDFRVFKLQRIRDIKVLKETFVRKESSCPSESDFERGEKLENVKILFRKEYVERVVDTFSEEYISYRENGDAVVEIESTLNSWIREFLLSFGASATVLEPLELQIYIKNEYSKALENY